MVEINKEELVMNVEKFIKVTKWIVDFMFFTGLVVLVTLPFTMKLAAIHYSESIEEHYVLMVITFAIAGVFGLLIVDQLRRMMKTVVSQNCFVQENVRSLEVMGWFSFAIAIVFILKIFFLPTPATFIIIITFFIAGLFSEVLSCVFREAVRYKEENDLTI